MSKKLKIVILIIILFITVVSFTCFTIYSFSKYKEETNIETSLPNVKFMIEDKNLEDSNSDDNDTNLIEENVVIDNNSNNTSSSENANNSTSNSNNTTTSSSNTNSTASNSNTNTNTDNNTDTKSDTNIDTSSNTTNTNTAQSSYVGVPNPNDFYYSYHHGVIDYKVSDYPNQDVMQVCIDEAIRISLKDTVDIINTNCIDVMDGVGTLLGEYLYINCTSGNCDKYKD